MTDEKSALTEHDEVLDLLRNEALAVPLTSWNEEQKTKVFRSYVKHARADPIRDE